MDSLHPDVRMIAFPNYSTKIFKFLYMLCIFLEKQRNKGRNDQCFGVRYQIHLNNSKYRNIAAMATVDKIETDLKKVSIVSFKRKHLITML
jgi:hypothetical protein